MSADNSITILKTPGINGGFEYRVKHLQAIENVYYDWNDRSDCETTDSAIWIKNAREMWQGCEVFFNEDDAFKKAVVLEIEITRSGAPLEYGICTIEIPEIF